MIYANHAGTSWPKPRAVLAAVAESLAAPPPEGLRAWAEAQQRAAEWLGLPDPERLILTPACTASLAVAIGDLPWSAGDGVLTSALEHHALLRPLAPLVRHHGVTHHVAPRGSETPIDLDFVEARLRAGGVRLVAATAASNVTGECLPVAELGALAHEHGALFLLDAAQWLGVRPFDWAGHGRPDLLTFAGHKGPLAPQGVGGLWSSAHVRFASPDVCGGGRWRTKPAPSYCDTGSSALAAAAGLGAGLAWLGARGDDPGRAARETARELARSLASDRRFRLLGAPGCERTAVVAFALDGDPPAAWEDACAERGLVLRAGQHCAPDACAAVGAPDGVVRVSFGPGSEDVGPDTLAILQAAARTLR